MIPRNQSPYEQKLQWLRDLVGSLNLEGVNFMTEQWGVDTARKCRKLRLTIYADDIETMKQIRRCLDEEGIKPLHASSKEIMIEPVLDPISGSSSQSRALD